jgi:uncharacterized membrane protein
MSLALNTYSGNEEQGGFSFHSRPNCSLTQRERKHVFMLIAIVTMLIASIFSWLGYWLILPFAGLEIGVLAWAFESFCRRADDYESLHICGDEIQVERRQGKNLERRTLNSHWARLVIVGAKPGRRVELALLSHGQTTELGLFLTDEERMELAGELQAWISTGR